MLVDIDDDGLISSRLIGNQRAFAVSVSFIADACCMRLVREYVDRDRGFLIEIVELSVKYVTSPARGRAIAARNDLLYTTTMVLANTIIVGNEDLKISLTIDFEAAKYSMAPQKADVLMEEITMSLMRVLGRRQASDG